MMCTAIDCVEVLSEISFDKQGLGLSSAISRFQIIVRHIPNSFIRMIKSQIIQRLVDVVTHIRNTRNLQ